MDKLGLNLGYLLVQVFNFLIIFVVLRAWLYKPLLNMLDKRRKTIEQGVEDARIAAEARANAEKDAAKIVAEAQSKAAQTIREATERAEVASKDVKAGAEAEAAKARDAAMSEVEEERNRMLGDLRGQVAALAIAAAQKLVGDALDEKRQHALINDFFSGVKSGKVVVLEGVSVSGGAAQVTSALPLSTSEQETVKKDVLAKVGKQASVTFRVDPSILGGLVVRVGDKVLDGSVAAQLEGLRQSLK
ncbi:MAG: F0F1 ATP synthase subunit B [Chloroflexi bacterium]|nr:F0F1 ATP synthase subunit B [Chloroflexota bacterium]